jgi:MinD superfamily P-loop ATPase
MPPRNRGKLLRIAIASGKGGTGKTTVATSLALSLVADPGQNMPGYGPPLFLDCDVEAPNAHLFLKPTFDQHQEVSNLIPQVNEEKCTGCGQCAEVCQYHAIAVLGNKTLVFPQLCHGCGSCMWICPEKAISEIQDELGILERGLTPTGIDFARGVLNIGEPMAVPIIRQLKHWAVPKFSQVVIQDAPPGTSCPVVESIKGADFVLLVTEPTPFGLHDLKLAAQVSRELNLKAGVIINRYDGYHSSSNFALKVDAYCLEQALPVLMRIPYERVIAEGIARGKTLIEIHPEFVKSFQELFFEILRLSNEKVTKDEAIGHPER